MSDTRVPRRGDAGRTLCLMVGLFIVVILYGAFIHSNIQIGHGQSASTPSFDMPEKRADMPERRPNMPVVTEWPDMPVLTKWPELVGTNKDEAVARIQAERPDLNQVTAIPNGTPVTKDLRFDRVRVFYDPETENVGPDAPEIA
eukprot:Clim_evm2s188 gene=Clim_evmTU2s188